MCVCVCIYICIYEKGFPPFFFSLFTSTPKPKACSIHPLSKKGERRLANLRFYAPGLFAVDVCERNNISAAFFSLSFLFFFFLSPFVVGTIIIYSTIKYIQYLSRQRD